MNPALPSIEYLLEEVCASPKYARMDPGLIRALVELEVSKRAQH